MNSWGYWMTNRIINGYNTLAPIWSILVNRNPENAVTELQILLDKIKSYSEHIFTELNITEEVDREVVRAVILSLMEAAYSNEQDQIFDSVETFTTLIIESVRSNIVTAEFANDLAPNAVLSKTKMACDIHVYTHKNSLLNSNYLRYSREIIHAISKINRKIIEKNPQLQTDLLSIILTEASATIFLSLMESKSLDWKLNSETLSENAEHYLATCIKQFEVTQESIISALVQSDIFTRGGC